MTVDQRDLKALAVGDDLVATCEACHKKLKPALPAQLANRTNRLSSIAAATKSSPFQASLEDGYQFAITPYCWSLQAASTRIHETSWIKAYPSPTFSNPGYDVAQHKHFACSSSGRIMVPALYEIRSSE